METSIWNDLPHADGWTQSPGLELGNPVVWASDQEDNSTSAAWLEVTVLMSWVQFKAGAFLCGAQMCSCDMTRLSPNSCC